MVLVDAISWKLSLSSLLIYSIYYNTLNSFPDELVVGLYGTIKSSQTDTGIAVLEQIVGTAILVMMILVITDPLKNNSVLIKSVCIGAILNALALSLSLNGFAFNP